MDGFLQRVASSASCAAWFAGFCSGGSPPDGPPRRSQLWVQHSRGSSTPSRQIPTADYATVSPDYFRVMRIPLLRGRFFSEQDSPSNPKVAIISETLAQRYFPNQDPIGRQMRF